MIEFLVIMFTCLLLGFHIVAPLMLSGIYLLFTTMPQIDSMIIVQQLTGGTQSFVLLAIPMFILAAEIMVKGETADRLVNLVQAFVGHMRGGLAITTTGACTIFGSISGSTQATIAAIGRPMRARMLAAGYRDDDTLGLIINAADIAVLIPPSSIMIMYAVVTGTSVKDLFTAGIVPGLIIMVFFCIYSYINARIQKTPVEPKMTGKERVTAIKQALLPLGFPVLVLGGIYGGFCSPTEAAAVAVLYALVLEMFVYKSIKWKDLPEMAFSTASVTAVVFILVAAGAVFSWVISFARIPAAITQVLLGDNPSALWIIFIVNLVFFIGCMFVDSLVLITVVVPIFFPIAMKVGIDPVFLGIIITMQSAIGCATPPFGCNIFTACAIFNRPFNVVARKTWAYIAILLVVVVLLVMFPQLVLGLKL